MSSNCPIIKLVPSSGNVSSTYSLVALKSPLKSKLVNDAVPASNPSAVVRLMKILVTLLLFLCSTIDAEPVAPVLLSESLSLLSSLRSRKKVCPLVRGGIAVPLTLL